MDFYRFISTIYYFILKTGICGEALATINHEINLT